MSVAVAAVDRHVATSRRILDDLFRWYGPRDFSVRYWDADEQGPDDGQPNLFTWVFNHPGALRAAYIPPTSAAFGGAYLHDDFDVEGDMLAFTRMGNYLHDAANHRLTWRDKLRLGWNLLKLPNIRRPRAGKRSNVSGELHSRDRDLQAVSYHYNFSNRCFELMLGPSMGYTSGVYAHEHEDLDTAQYRKFDLICRKLRLRPGHRLLDVGCGWAGLVMHAAKHYGARCVGVTISDEQLKYARAAVERAGLSDRIRIDLCDYRNIDPAERFDAISTVEVAEHFGVAQFPTYFRKMRSLLKPHGNLLLQQITLQGDRDTTAAPSFNQAYVFPDGELANLSVTLKAATNAGFEVRDAESFREHYKITLRQWLERTEAARDEIVAESGEAGYRKFRIFYGGAYYGFDANAYNVYQVLFANPDDRADCGLPLNRTDWYARDFDAGCNK